MARGIEENRKISIDRVKKHRYKKNNILIAVEGKNKTEKIYFNNFEKNTKNYNIVYAKGNDTDPLKLVKSLVDEILKMDLDFSYGDKVYCVFDTDMDSNKNKIIKEAEKIAKENNIEIITSTPCVELWFLLHYDYTTAILSNEEVIKRLKKYYPKYEKNVNIYNEINDNVKVAVDRAKKLEKYQIDNNKQIGTVEANPNTEMYKVVEYLISKS